MKPDEHTGECRTWALGMAVRTLGAEARFNGQTAVRFATLESYATGLQGSGVCSCAQLALVDRGLDA